MTEIGSGASLFVAGCVASCGVLLVVAGASKLYRAARQVPDASAVRRALGVTRRRWRPVQVAAGAGFCVLLGYARVRRVPGGCGCIQWRTAPPPAAGIVSWREIARAALVAAAGAVGAVFLRGEAGAVDRPWFWAGIAAGGGLLMLLSMRTLPRTPVCRRPVWFPARATLPTLAGHGVFEAMAESAGPFGPVVRYRRSGCSEEFWVTPLPPGATGPGRAGDGGQRAVVFRTQYATRGGGLAVQASVRDAEAVADRPARSIGARDSMLAGHG